MSPAFIIMAVSTALSPDATSHFAGQWEGVVSAGDQSVKIVVRVEKTDDGLRAVMDSPEQGVRGLPITDLTQTGDAVRFSVPSIGGTFEGGLSADGATLTGIWRQGPMSVPLVLTRTATEVSLTPVRPQNPVEPLNYRAEPAAFENVKDSVSLAGILTLPEGEGPFPVAVLLSGTGPQDRDETMFDHKPFLILADYLTRRGIAVLRYDDRGVGQSAGDFSAASVPDFVGDALAAVTYLASHPEIDPRRIGLIGHSEGGIVAPLVAEAGGNVAWIVTLAGPAVSGELLIGEQHLRLARASGLPEEAALAANRVQRSILAAIARNASDGEAAAREVESILVAAGQPEAAAAAAAAEVSAPWFRWLVAHDPAPGLAQLTVPMLAVYGGKDLQVPADLNSEALAAIRPSAKVVVFPSLNHLMQTAETGSPTEYEIIEETMSPEVLETIADWVVDREPVPASVREPRAPSGR